MTKCTRCKQSFDRQDMIGCNIFDASTGTHIKTHWYCHFCAKVLGLIVEVIKQ